MLTPWGRTKEADLKRLAGYEIAKKNALRLTTADYIARVETRRRNGAGLATAHNDLIWLRQVLRSARASLITTLVKTNPGSPAAQDVDDPRSMRLTVRVTSDVFEAVSHAAGNAGTTRPGIVLGTLRARPLGRRRCCRRNPRRCPERPSNSP